MLCSARPVHSVQRPTRATSLLPRAFRAGLAADLAALVRRRPPNPAVYIYHQGSLQRIYMQLVTSFGPGAGYRIPHKSKKPRKRARRRRHRHAARHAARAGRAGLAVRLRVAAAGRGVRRRAVAGRRALVRLGGDAGAVDAVRGRDELVREGDICALRRVSRRRRRRRRRTRTLYRPPPEWPAWMIWMVALVPGRMPAGAASAFQQNVPRPTWTKRGASVMLKSAAAGLLPSARLTTVSASSWPALNSSLPPAVGHGVRAADGPREPPHGDCACVSSELPRSAGYVMLKCAAASGSTAERRRAKRMLAGVWGGGVWVCGACVGWNSEQNWREGGGI